MENEAQTIKQRKILIIVGAIVFVVLVIFIGVVWELARENQYNTDIANEDALKEDLSASDTKRVKKEISDVVRNIYGLDKSETIKTNMRAASYKEAQVNNGTNAEFIIDVESVKVTYKVWMLKNSDNEFDIFLSCASMDETNYPDNFCIGTDNNSTIDVTLEDKLPHNGKVGNHIYTVSHVSSSPKLDVYVNSCGDEEIIEMTRQSVKDWIKSLGYNAEMFPIDVSKEICYDSYNN